MKRINKKEYEEMRKKMETVEDYWDDENNCGCTRPVAREVSYYSDRDGNVDGVKCKILSHEDGFFSGMNGSWCTENMEKVAYIPIKELEEN